MNEEINKALQTIKNGGLILYPTDTVWGIGCDATNDKVCKKVSGLKNNPSDKPLICLVSSDAMLNRIVSDVPEIAWDLIDESVNPLTIVLPNGKGVCKSVLAEDGSIAVRFVKNGLLQQLIHNFGEPIISTSANLHGNNFAKSFSKIDGVIKCGVDFVIDETNFPLGTNKPSSIIKVGASNEIKIIRA